jgi:ATP-dependent RNA helicase DDX52/ROK1
MSSASLLLSGTNFTGSKNEKAKKLFKATEQIENIGELADYTVLDQFEVAVSGTDAPPPISDWKILNSDLQSSLSQAGFVQPTPAQKYAIPCILNGRNLITISPTGSGKTLAYALPLLHLLEDRPRNELNGLVLVPTRELASQVFRQFRRFAAAGGTRTQLLRKNRDVPECQILIATPKRILVAQPDLSGVQNLVIDEADHLLSHSFVKQTDEVLAKISHSSFHVFLFSATLGLKVEETARSFMLNAVRVHIDDHSVASLITQELKFVGKEKGKLVEIRQRLESGELALPVIIFVMNKLRAYDLAEELGVPCAVLTSDESDTDRADAIRKLRTCACQFLIATDLGARGIDLAAVQTVINFDLPPDSTTYIHRIGRTARAGRTGRAITLFTTDDQGNLRSVAMVMKRYGFPVEEWMLKGPDKEHRGARALFQPVARHTISSRVWKNAKARSPKVKGENDEGE